MKRLMAIGILLVAWTASVPTEAMSLGVRMALWGTAPAHRQASGGNLADAVEAHGLTFETGGDAAWFVQSEVAHEGETALRSGAIGDDEGSWVETVVTDAGTVSFWWKTSSEVYKKTPIDFVSFSIDGGERARLGGETAWTNMTFAVSGSGRHVLRWVYSKDMMDTSGEDCAWLDGIAWIPDDPLPALPSNASTKDIATALAGTADANLAKNITNATSYAAFREWAKSAGAVTVKESNTAWLSYAVGAAGIVPMPQDGDLVIDEVTVGSDGKLDAVFSLDGVSIGAAALESRLKTVFGVEGAATLDKAAFSDQNIGLSLAPTGDGRIKAKVTPPADSGNSFFMRVKVK